MSTTMSFEQDITEDVETNTSEDGGHDIIEVESTYTYNVATSNRFANLEQEHDLYQPEDNRDLEEVSRAKTPEPNSAQHSVPHDEVPEAHGTPYPLPQCVPSTPGHLLALVQNMKDWGSTSVKTVPLPHMLHDIHKGWLKT